MGYTLYGEFSVQSERDPSYWWPLLLEAMHWRSFSFTAPDQPEGMGYYYYVRFDDPSDTDFVQASIRAVWEEIYSGTSDILLSLWFTGKESFPLDLSIKQSKDAQDVRILLALSDAYLLDLSSEEVKQRLHLMLNCSRSLYHVCSPCVGTMYWADTNFPPLASYNTPLEKKLWGKEVEIVERPLSDGNSMYLVRPMPVRVRGGWDFVSLYA